MSVPKRAIVTGSDSGIGKATAVALAGAGFDVGITWHADQQGARDTAAQVEERGRRAEVRRLDLLHLPGVADVIENLVEELGGVSVFVNNSGTSPAKPFLDLSFDEWMATLDVDLHGAFVCAQCAARHMVEAGSGGRIINVTSVHEHIPLPNASAYCAAKGGAGPPHKGHGARARPSRHHRQFGCAGRDSDAHDRKRRRRSPQA